MSVNSSNGSGIYLLQTPCGPCQACAQTCKQCRDNWSPTDSVISTVFSSRNTPRQISGTPNVLSQYLTHAAQISLKYGICVVGLSLPSSRKTQRRDTPCVVFGFSLLGVK